MYTITNLVFMKNNKICKKNIVYYTRNNNLSKKDFSNIETIYNKICGAKKYHESFTWRTPQPLYIPKNYTKKINNLELIGNNDTSNNIINVNKTIFINCKFYDFTKQYKTRQQSEYFIIKINEYLKNNPDIEINFKNSTFYINSIENNTIKLIYNSNSRKSTYNFNFNKISIQNNILILDDASDRKFKITDTLFLEYLKQSKKTISGYKTKRIQEEAQEEAQEQNQNVILIQEEARKIKNTNFNFIFEILGSWLWIEKPKSKEALSYLLDNNFKFSSSKLKFYKYFGEYKKKSSKCLSYDKIKSLYQKMELMEV